MKWTPEQESAIDAVGRWLREGDDQVFYLSGYAGTGKTSLAQHLAADAGCVLFGAYTGKAAHVLRQRGCLGATTIHRLIYRCSDRSALRVRELEKELSDLDAVPEGERSAEDTKRRVQLARDIAAEHAKMRQPLFTVDEEGSPVQYADLVVIDECSMVDERIGRDLLSFGKKVLVLGDPGQLPPVRGGGFFTEREPDFMLRQIHRQAEGSPIIELATKVRLGDRLEAGGYGESTVLDWADITPELAMNHDQILVGKNRTRRGTNRRVRELRGFEGDLPVAGDRLVCLRNDHEAGLLNGGIWSVLDSTQLDAHQVGLTVEDDEGTALSCEAHIAPFLGQDVQWFLKRDAQEFDYGYALTCHKSQGSQWGSVIVFDESRSFGQDARRWLYTAITRAAERVTVVL